jgi:vacuolar-type H+-ATPase subunit H
MHEVIQGLIEAEGEARAIVQRARAEADRLVADAQQRAHDGGVRARQETRAQAAETIETAVEGAGQEKCKRLEQARAEIQCQVQMTEARRDRLADAVVRCVCGQP